VTFPNAGPHSGYYDRDGLCALFHPRPKRCASTRSACFDARAITRSCGRSGGSA
jgi:hypothetical protein